MSLCSPGLVYDSRDGLAAGETQLHDVGELAGRVVHREVVGDD